MKVRTLIVSIVVVLIVSSLSPAKDMNAPEPVLQESASPALLQPEPPLEQTASPSEPQAPRLRRQNIPSVATPLPARETPPSIRPTRTPKTPPKVTIFELKHAKASELINLIATVFRITVYPDHRLNRLIVSGAEEQIRSVASLIEEMDVDAPEASRPREIQDFVYRIYMFEIPSGDQVMKSFSMILQTSAKLSSTELLDAATATQIQISDFFLSEEGREEQAVEILIQGKAPTNESIKQMIEKIPYIQIRELKWDDDETFTDKIAAAQYTQLPEQMQKHIGKFLGDDIRTVGYWFGNLSVPGGVEVPIGPWTLNLRLDTESDRMLELNVDVEMSGEMHHFDRRLGRQRNGEILSNTIRAKIGKPIIIGYNRESYGTRKMGAMVIVPEEDAAQLKTF